MGHRKLLVLSAVEYFAASWVHGKCTLPEPQFPLFPMLAFWSAVSSADVLRPGRGHTWLQRASRGTWQIARSVAETSRAQGWECVFGVHMGVVWPDMLGLNHILSHTHRSTLPLKHKWTSRIIRAMHYINVWFEASRTPFRYLGCVSFRSELRMPFKIHFSS